MPVVLVVEDHPAIALAVAASVRFSGYQVVVAHSGPEALAFLLRRTPDLVVLDESMPGMSGLDVLRALRSDGGCYPNPPPVVMFSASDAAREESARLGAAGFVLKTEADALVPQIRRTLGLAKSVAATRSQKG